MKTRLISAILLIPVLLAVLLICPVWVTTVALAIFSAIGVYELLYRTRLVTHVRLVAYSMAASCAVPFFCHFHVSYPWIALALLLFCALLFAEMMHGRGKVTFEKAALCVMGGIVMPLAFSSVLRILSADYGRYLILTPFVLTMLPDSGAYFAGRFFGKHKLAPVLSPKKTVEGAIGGVLSGMFFMAVYALVLEKLCGFQVNFAVALIYGVLGSLGAVFGDLCFSAIKRQTGIKDYGNLIPGHGGVLDRFDSLMIVGPLTEILMILLPMAVKAA